VLPKSPSRSSDNIARTEMTSGHTARRLTDVSRAAELLALVHAAFGGLEIQPPSSVLKETAAGFAARLASETCFVIESDSRLIASVFCIRQGDALYIGRLAVAPEWRGKRLATALIEAAKEEARRIGAKHIILKVRVALASNVVLFRRHGFAIVAEETQAGYPAPTSYVMELRVG
jgi:GNAT superfamily N-acetyltransferase